MTKIEATLISIFVTAYLASVFFILAFGVNYSPAVTGWFFGTSLMIIAGCVYKILKP